jgi:hypothetical protein
MRPEVGAPGPGDRDVMTCLIVHRTAKGYYGEAVEYKRSGSGFYRETTSVAIPHTKSEIVAFAKENGYSIEWRDVAPEAAGVPGHVDPAGAAAG